MIYLLKFLYSWLLPPAVFVLLLLWLAWRLRKKNTRLAGWACLVALLLYVASIRPVSRVSGQMPACSGRCRLWFCLWCSAP